MAGSASLNNTVADLEDDYDFEGDEDSAGSGKHHPFLSRRSLSKATFEASHAFVNAMIIQSSSEDDATTID
ncbi:hypothetical protein GGF38_005355, partial [Coemansia sp. RSA 25]